MSNEQWHKEGEPFWNDIIGRYEVHLYDGFYHIGNLPLSYADRIIADHNAAQELELLRAEVRSITDESTDGTGFFPFDTELKKADYPAIARCFTEERGTNL